MYPYCPWSKNNLNIVIILYGVKKEKMKFLKMLNIISSKRCFIRAIVKGNQAIVCKENTMYVMSTKILQQTLREPLDSEYHADQELLRHPLRKSVKNVYHALNVVWAAVAWAYGKCIWYAH